MPLQMPWQILHLFIKTTSHREIKLTIDYILHYGNSSTSRLGLSYTAVLNV